MLAYESIGLCAADSGLIHESHAIEHSSHAFQSELLQSLQELLTKAHTAAEGPALTKLKGKLSAEEAALFSAGAESMAAFERWRYSTSTAIRGPRAQSKPRLGPARPALQDIANQAAHANSRRTGTSHQ